MCLAIPMKIEAVEGTTATVSAAGSKTNANVMLIEEPKVGEYVLVHAGFAIRKIDEAEAVETIKTLNKLIST
jgi:hydrogenase expression/formation protein HypC